MKKAICFSLLCGLVLFGCKDSHHGSSSPPSDDTVSGDEMPDEDGEEEEPPFIEWEIFIDNLDIDRVTSVRQTSDGGYIIAGNTHPWRMSKDVLLIKLDSSGNLDPGWLQNPRIFGWGEQDDAISIQQTPDGGYIVAGSISSFGDLGTEVFILKLDSQGNFDSEWGNEWPENPKTFGGPDNQMVNTIWQTDDGGYVLAGEEYFTIFIAEGIDRRSSDIYVIKLDFQGNLDPVWPENPKTFGNPWEDEARDIKQTQDGGYVLAGSTNVSGGWKPYIVKLDSWGNLILGRSDWGYYGSVYVDLGISQTFKSVQQTSDGDYIVVGTASDFNSRHGRWEDYKLIVKFDSNLRFYSSWLDTEFEIGRFKTNRPRNYGTGAASAVEFTTDGGYIIGGTSLLKLDQNGNQIWSKDFGVVSVQQTSDGGYIIASDYSENEEHYDIYVAKLGPDSSF